MSYTTFLFIQLKVDVKTIEVRLNDQKMRSIQPNDILTFVYQKETIITTVVELLPYDSFLDLYQTIPFVEMDCENWTMHEMLAATYKFYTKSEEEKWGAVAIRITTAL